MYLVFKSEISSKVAGYVTTDKRCAISFVVDVIEQTRVLG
jgi:hypothetical protein